MKTAVEWLHSEYIKIFGELNPSTSKLIEIAYVLEQAKEMEKEQIMEAFEAAEKDCGRDFLHGDLYYNETFKSE